MTVCVLGESWPAHSEICLLLDVTGHWYFAAACFEVPQLPQYQYGKVAEMTQSFDTKTSMSQVGFVGSLKSVWAAS